MKIKKYGQSDYCILTHNRYKCLYTLVQQPDGRKEAHNVNFPNLLYTKFSSSLLKEKSARTLGEILIKIADTLNEKKGQ